MTKKELIYSVSSVLTENGFKAIDSTIWSIGNGKDRTVICLITKGSYKSRVYVKFIELHHDSPSASRGEYRLIETYPFMRKTWQFEDAVKRIAESVTEG